MKYSKSSIIFPYAATVFLFQNISIMDLWLQQFLKADYGSSLIQSSLKSIHARGIAILRSSNQDLILHWKREVQNFPPLIIRQLIYDVKQRNEKLENENFPVDFEIKDDCISGKMLILYPCHIFMKSLRFSNF